MDRQLHNEAAALAFLTDRADASAVQQHDLPYDRQAQPGPAAVTASRLVDPVETIKHMRQVLGPDARAVIADCEYDISS